MNQQFGAQLDRIQQNTINPNQQNMGMGMSMMGMGGFGGGQQRLNQGYQNQGFGGLQQGVNQAQLNQIHQNSVFGGNSQPDNFQVQRIQQATISGEESNPLGMGMMMGGYGSPQSFNQGYQNQSYQNQGYQNQGYGGMTQSVNQAQIDRIHQNSLYNGQSEPSGAFQQVAQRIHQNSLYNGGSQSSAQGFGGYQNQIESGGYGAQQYYNQGVSQAQLNQVHQNSIYNGQSEPSNNFSQEVQCIHQNSLFNGGSQSPAQGFGGYQNQIQSGGYGAQQSFSQGVNQAQIDRIHQNSLFGGQSQPSSGFQQQTQRIHQNSLFNGGSGGSQGFGGASMSMMGMGGQGFNQQQQNQGFVNQNAFQQVMSADAGIQDNEGPSSYPASMFRGNQYDTVNQSAMNQMANMGSPFGRQF